MYSVHILSIRSSIFPISFIFYADGYYMSKDREYMFSLIERFLYLREKEDHYG